MDTASFIIEEIVLDEFNRQLKEQNLNYNISDFRLKHDTDIFNPYMHTICITYLPIRFSREFYIEVLHLEKSYLETLKRPISNQISMFFEEIKPWTVAFS